MTTKKGSRKNPTRYPDAAPARRVVVRKRRQPSVRSTVSARRARTVVYTAGTLIAAACIVHAMTGFARDIPYFKLETLQVSGVSQRIESEVRALVGTVVEKHGNLLSLDISEIGRVMQSNPRIRNLRVQKIYPDTLVVEAAEREPEAIVSADGFFLVDREGMVIDKLNPGDLREHDLVYITGISPDEMRVGEKIYQSSLYRALDMIRILRQRSPDLYQRFSEVHIERDPITHLDNLTANLTGGMEVRFGDSNPIERLPLLEFFVMTLKEKDQDPFAMMYLDLRFKDQIVFLEKDKAIAMARDKYGIDPADEEMEKLLKDQESRTVHDSGSSAPPRRQPPASSRSSSSRSSGGAGSASGAPASQRTEAPAVQQSQEQPAAAQPQQGRRGLSRLAFWKRDGGQESTPAPAAPAQPRRPLGIPNPFGQR